MVNYLPHFASHLAQHHISDRPNGGTDFPGTWLLKLIDAEIDRRRSTKPTKHRLYLQRFFLVVFLPKKTHNDELQGKYKQYPYQ